MSALTETLEQQVAGGREAPNLVDDAPKGLGALYVAPIKALLNNQAEPWELTPRWWGFGELGIDVGDLDRNLQIRVPVPSPVSSTMVLQDSAGQASGCCSR